MAHARKQIRDAVVTALTGLATTGSRVKASRNLPIADGAAPSLSIYTAAEESDVLAMGGPRTLYRDLDLIVEGAIQSTSFDDLADDVAVEVEVAMAADPSLGGLVRDVVLRSTSLGLDGENSTPSGVIKLTFQVTYATAENAPETLI